MMKIIIFIFCSFIFTQDKQIYSTEQMIDQVVVINPETLQIEDSVNTEFGSSEQGTNCMDITDEMSCNMSGECEWIMEMCMETSDNSVMNTPHFVALDELNGYWFVTTIASGYVAQFSLLDNSLIDTYFVGDAPALLAVDPLNKKVYCSRMMPMNGMGNMMPTLESNIIQGLNYSSIGLAEAEDQEYTIDSPAPHGLALNHDGTELYTASNTADWLYKINTATHEITGVAMDSEVSNSPDQITQRLKPIQCISVGNRLFVSCSSGVWYNPYSGEQSIIPGSLQMWNSDSMVLIDSIDLGEHTAPWHIKESPIDGVIYVVLSGDNLYDTEGLACVRYDNDVLSLAWTINNPSFDTLHGIDVSSDGHRIYVSGRGDGNIHVFDSSGNYLDNVLLGGMSMLGGLTIEKDGLPLIGDLNNDLVFNIFDVVILVELIINDTLNSPYSYYSSDINSDQDINVLDIIEIINMILNSI